MKIKLFDINFSEKEIFWTLNWILPPSQNYLPVSKYDKLSFTVFILTSLSSRLLSQVEGRTKMRASLSQKQRNSICHIWKPVNSFGTKGVVRCWLQHFISLSDTYSPSPRPDTPLFLLNLYIIYNFYKPGLKIFSHFTMLDLRINLLRSIG